MITNHRDAALLPRIEDYLRSHEACEIMQISMPTFMRWWRHGVNGVRLRSVKIGKRRLTTHAWIQEFHDTLALQDAYFDASVRTRSDESIAEAEQYLRKSGVLED